jgi:quercetin dioxygenase-like cupin family protein
LQQGVRTSGALKRLNFITRDQVKADLKNRFPFRIDNDQQLEAAYHSKRRGRRVWYSNYPLNWEVIMLFRTTGILLLGAMALAAPAAAQTTSAPPAITRTVVAATKLPTVTDVPLYFKAVSVTLQPGEKSGVSAANGIVYQISGSTEVSLGGEAKMLSSGEGLFIAGGKTAVLKAGSGGPSTFLHLFLAPAVDLDRPVETAPAAVRELYRTAAPIPDLKPGGYDLNLTRVTFPAQMPSNPPHHRSGAALYYIISGTGANTIDGKTAARGPGSLIYEPYGLVHQWGNPGDEPLTFLAFNINPEGVAAVLPGAPAKSQ